MGQLILERDVLRMGGERGTMEQRQELELIMLVMRF